MTGGGSGSEEPTGFLKYASPIAKIIGLGIAARGGALGPMLVGSGELIDEGYRARVQRNALQTLLDVMQPRERSETTAGIPATPARAFQPGDIEGLGTPRVEAVPEVPGVAPTTQTWRSDPTRGEMLEALRGRPMTPSTQMVIEELIRGKFPTEPERPATATEALTRARALEEERRKADVALAEERRRAGVIGPALRPGATPEERGAAAAAGVLTPEPPPSTETITQGGFAITKNPRTGDVLRVEPLRTPEQTEELSRLKSIVIPHAEARMREDLQSGALTPAQGRVVQALLEEAKASADPSSALQRLDAYLEKIAVPAKPSASQETLLNYMAASQWPDTPENRERARRALMKEREASQLHVAASRQVTADAVKELGKLQHQVGLLDQVDQADGLADRMEAAMRRLAKYNGAGSTFNWLRQQLAARGGIGTHARDIADSLAAVQAANARYASIAQGIEGVTGNRIAQTLVERMRAMHVHEDEPLSRNLERLRELRGVVSALRAQINKHANDIIVRQQRSLESFGRTPLESYEGLATSPEGGWTAEPEPEAALPPVLVPTQ